MLEVIGAAPGAKASRDWVQAWKDSPELVAVNRHLDELKSSLSSFTAKADGASLAKSYATPFYLQLYMCTKRALEQSWRDPSYIYAKLGLCTTAVSWTKPHYKFCTDFRYRVSSSASPSTTNQSAFKASKIKYSPSSCSLSSKSLCATKPCRTSSHNEICTKLENVLQKLTPGKLSCSATSLWRSHGTL